MKRAGWFTYPAVTMAAVGLTLPQGRAAELPAPPRAVAPLPTQAAPAATISDVALSEGSVLRGQVVDPQGAPLRNQPVAVRQLERTVATTRTDLDGRFSVSGLPGGVYQIITPDGFGVFRLWAPRTAPPAAQQAALIVAGQQMVRGQAPGGPVRAFFTSPWVLAGLLGAAIIVPIALNNREKIPTS
jgi:hypothetical protein